MKCYFNNYLYQFSLLNSKKKNRDLRQEGKGILSTKILTVYTFNNNKAKYPSVGSLKQ